MSSESLKHTPEPRMRRRKGGEMSEKVYGCKLLRPDNTSIGDEHGHVQYQYGWNDVPEGAYIAVTGGAEYGGVPADAIIRWFECDPNSEFKPDKWMPVGVRCFKRVRMLRRKPKGALPLAKKRWRTIIVRGWWPNGSQLYREKYRNGRLHGTVEAWLEDGSQFYREKYRNGKRHGIWVGWYSDGQQEYRHPYRNGRLHGIVEAWREDGSPIYREEYRDGKPYGVHEGWHPDGQLAYRRPYRDGQLHGIVESWWGDSSPKYRREYRDGKLHGVCVSWYPNGQQEYCHKYRDGKLIA